MPSYTSIQHYTFHYHRLLVGAPAADSRQPGVYRGGAVYKCPPESPRDCEIIPFDQEGKHSIFFLYNFISLKLLMCR